MFASIACTGWFFYSWLQGVPGLVGAAVGCAIQLMAYGFFWGRSQSGARLFTRRFDRINHLCAELVGTFKLRHAHWLFYGITKRPRG